MAEDVDASTYLALHMLGEHVLAAARYASDRRIGLTVVDGGIATPPFGEDNRQVAVIDSVLVVSDADGQRTTRVTTLGAARAFVGVTDSIPADVYLPATTCHLDAPLVLDSLAFVRIVDWYTRVQVALSVLAADSPGAAEVTLWPEHFDVATRINNVNYGGLGGDKSYPSPYAYVGPSTSLLPSGQDDFWNAPFGAVVESPDVPSSAELLSFFRRGRDEARMLTSRRQR